jgi:hypothetical protein
MRFSNFLFPASTSAADDGRAIDKTLEEARLTDTLGCDTIWLAEPISKAPSPMSIRSLRGRVGRRDDARAYWFLYRTDSCTTRSDWRHRSR